MSIIGPDAQRRPAATITSRQAASLRSKLQLALAGLVDGNL